MRSAVATRQNPHTAISVTTTSDASAMSGEGGDEPPTESQAVPPPSDASLFGASLEPILRHQLDDRLSSVAWFRTDWQRGGALTGFATFTDDQDQPQDVVVKMPVPPRERDWLKACHDHPQRDPACAFTPHLYAHGDTLNGYDLAWVVMEKLPYGPLNRKGSDWGATAFELLIAAAADFQHAADETPPTGLEIDRRDRLTNDWGKLFAKARQQVKAKSFPLGQAWKKALKQHAKQFEVLCEQWHQRPTTGWCHGDLHLGNAMSRSPQATHDGHAHCVLIDFACVRPGHWVEDAVYCEHLYWGRPDALHGQKPASQLAKARKTRGLNVDEDWSEWADRLRTLYALTAPATASHHGGSTAYLQAALERLG